MKYNADYFIKFFKKIPDKKWGTGLYFNKDTGKRCALGHCKYGYGRSSYTMNDKTISLCCILESEGRVSMINDYNDKRYPQKTPKARILAALKDAKKRGL